MHGCMNAAMVMVHHVVSDTYEYSCPMHKSRKDSRKGSRSGSAEHVSNKVWL
jgi:hypothetical protein